MKEIEEVCAKISRKINIKSLRGKKILINRVGTISYALDTPFDKMSIALYNFIVRRPDIVDPKYEDTSLYYGHVDGLGYFIAGDELRGEPKAINRVI